MLLPIIYMCAQFYHSFEHCDFEIKADLRLIRIMNDQALISLLLLIISLLLLINSQKQPISFIRDITKGR